MGRISFKKRAPTGDGDFDPVATAGRWMIAVVKDIGKTKKAKRGGERGDIYLTRALPVVLTLILLLVVVVVVVV